MNAVPEKNLAKSPYCEHFLDPETAVDGWVTCECGRKSDQRWVGELAWLQARSAWVEQRITKGDAWFDSRHHTVAPVTKPHKSASGQQLLYVLGGLSLVVAVAVFTAVAWQRIGAYGQLGALLLVVAIASFVATKSKENLVGLSNTSAVLATLVAGTGFLSAPYFGLVDESFSDSASIYRSAILKFLVIASFAAGYFSRISGWSFISVVGVLPTVIIFNETYLVSAHSRFVYQIGSATTVTFGVIAVAIMTFMASKRHAVSQLFKLSTMLIELFFVFILYIKLMESISGSEYPIFMAVGYLLLAVIWAVLAVKLPRDEQGFISNPASIIAAYVSSILIGFAIPISLLPAITQSEYNYDWHPISGSPDLLVISSVVIGALLVTSPILQWISEYKLNRYLTITGAITWYVTLEITNRLIFESQTSKFVTLTAISTVSISLMVRWWNEIKIWFFLPSVFFGSIAVGYGVGTFVAPHFDGPEAVTFSVALYLLLIAQVLVRKTRDPHNSFIVWGLAFCVALIPSSILANSILFTNYPGKTELLRFWAVIVVSVIALVSGLKLQKSGLLIPSAISFAIVAFPQIFIRLGMFVPRWIIFGAIGILLITIAARFEHLQKLGRDTSRWIRNLD